ncbi:MAG: cytochrome C [Sulfurimonas sp. RIFCSPHIGHO2_12_FULL_36_9]|uniref:c-type cytochrome n=1 Tax=unclassified Sulfurimonas TaxID=2623549 RepID=UPI0008B08AE7|nr:MULTISPECIES: cytochrome c [unclassified Sulfurimonas]OHD96678.1 MAG: cytochrome C [Sulfurimonas sp. RIFCSPHIGHO2_12_FULL_36_9]OHD97969.1 MAG: cytochrome C [Sulfurimonas sp. RIFCSPLOWO2_02_FULL_36_28]OHE00198.1 MAG: cytochrome C [Sulfurimonas sp. RIFCSPLOWO2_12_36_12]OHE05083.1 MAG: cytochrome C [Sulfurimonas sp. RIFCSPLOWO2_12_FULL_36_74]
MAKKSVWSDNRFWQRSAAWVTGFASMLLIWLTFDTIPQITMGTNADLQNGVTKRVPGPTVINYKITYEMDKKRGHEIPVIGEKEMFFGRDDWSEEEAAELLHLGKLGSQVKNCMNCHTLLGNGAYYAPDLTKAWLDPAWGPEGSMQAMTGKSTKEEAMSEFLQNPSQYPTHARMMPDLGITAEEAKGLVAFLKHMSSIDTNGFPRNFGKIQGAVHGK